MPTVSTTECPNCNHKGLIQRDKDHYQCLFCDFKRNLDTEEEGLDIAQTLVAGLLLVLFFRVFWFLDSNDRRQPQYINQGREAQVQVVP